MQLNRRQFIGLSATSLAISNGCLHRLRYVIHPPKPEINDLDILPVPTGKILLTEEVKIGEIDATGRYDIRPGKARYFRLSLGNDVSLTMSAIPGGKFPMGAPDNEKSSSDAERPQRVVAVEPFFMAATPITQAQYLAVMEQPLGHFTKEKLEHPVERVSWRDADRFCRKLSALTGQAYRLPLEKEWEHACRAYNAGNTDNIDDSEAFNSEAFAFGPTLHGQLANYDHRKGYLGTETHTDPKDVINMTTAVGEYPSNKWGLYDMHGNVWEWCHSEWRDNYRDMFIAMEEAAAVSLAESAESDDISPTKRVVRGGSWAEPPQQCRSASRGWRWSDSRFNHVGFRVVCTIAQDDV